MKDKKTQSQANQHPGSVKPNRAQEQKGRPTTERRQDEVPTQNDEQQQGYGDRFPRSSYEGGRERQ